MQIHCSFKLGKPNGNAMAFADEESDSNAAQGRKQGKAPTIFNLKYTQKSFKDCKGTTTLIRSQRQQLYRWKAEYIFAVQKQRFLELGQVVRQRAWNDCSFS